MTRNHKFYFLLTLILALTAETAKSQTCNGSLGDPVVKYDFDRGSPDRGIPIPQLTNYSYSSSGVPADGSYALVKTTAGMDHVNRGAWHNVVNHTENDPDGYMMLINADDRQAGLFYQQTIQNLCPGTTYEFGAWIINIMARPGIKPNVKFIIETTSGTRIKEFDTGEIPEGSSTDWKKYAEIFTTDANVTEVVVKIENNGLGGGGNDFCLDDITFRPCGPIITPNINGISTHMQYMCVGETRMFNFSAEVSPGVYGVPEYLWQAQDAAGIWQDLPGQTSNQLIRNFPNAQIGSYKFRMLAAEAGNINSPNCRSNSPEFMINVSPLPTPVISGATYVCVGESINLTVSDASSYKWVTPDGTAGTSKSLLLNNATGNMSGTYFVTVTNAAGCEETTEINVSVIAPPIAEIAAIAPICKGRPVMLEASGGTHYRWLPAEGLTDLTIHNPIVNPVKTTKYTVFVGNGVCERSAEITVVVLQDPLAEAGPDKKILKGKSTTLNGSRSGDEVTYFWTPATYLDDPLKLNPVANPPVSTTFTLHVVSRNGCITSTADVFVKVYEKLIVPNIFSPNGDGINDLWNITAIDTYAAPRVKIMDRNGQLMFQSANYTRSWDGKCRDQEVPVGVYYYIINLDADSAPLTGAITLIR